MAKPPQMSSLLMMSEMSFFLLMSVDLKDMRDCFQGKFNSYSFNVEFNCLVI